MASTTGTLATPGVGSGLDINSIVSKLMSVESQPLTQLATREASYQAELTAYGNLKGALSSFQSAVSGLTNLSVFQSLTATPADATIFTASAATGAVAGSYAVNVTNLAQAQTIMTAGQTSTTAAIGAGTTTTLTFQFGTITGTLDPAGTGKYQAGATFAQDPAQATGTVTIDSKNNSLQGIRDAINAANIGVSATIVSDGSASPNRLVLTSTKTGATSSMKVSVSGDATLQGLLGYDVVTAQNMSQTVAGQNVSATVNGVAITSASNTVTGAIQGVTLNLAKVGSSNLTVAQNTGAVQSALQKFVKGYNDLTGTLQSLSSYDPTTKQAGPLAGEFAVQTIQAQLRQVLNTTLVGLGGSLTNLSQVGISFQKDGTMALDSSKLQSAITNNFKDIAGLFAAVGTTTDSLVSYSGSSSKTQPGSYAVYISQLATQGNTTGKVDLTLGPTVIAAGTTISVSLDGTTSSVPLTAGSYSASGLAAMIQSAINGTSAFSSAGSSVSVDATSGFLSVTSSRFGSASKVSIGDGAGTLASSFMGSGATAPSIVNGMDVAGTIGGIAATGSGQYLTGAAGSSTEGLKIQITGGSVPGARGAVNFSQGYGVHLDNRVSDFLASSGIISSATDGINRRIEDIGNRRTALTERLTIVEKNYRKQFTALDVLLSQMQTTSSYLTQQLSMLQKMSTGA